MTSNKSNHVSNVFKQIAQLGESLQTLDEKILQIESELKKQQALRRKLAEETIPDLMREAEITSFRTEDGKEFRLQKKYSARISSANEERAFGWLAETNNDSIIKSEAIIPLDPDNPKLMEALDNLSEMGVGFNLTKKIHPSTLRAFVKEAIEDGMPGFPQDAFGVYIIEQVTIK